MEIAYFLNMINSVNIERQMFSHDIKYLIVKEYSNVRFIISKVINEI